jgi:hypothetical protein
MRLDSKSVALVVLCLSSVLACSAKPAPPPPEMVIRVEQHPDGVSDSIWEEPMIDVIDVPPGLDPDGVYYRPAHKEVVEIRQGRWKMHKKPVAAAPVDVEVSESIEPEECDEPCK